MKLLQQHIEALIFTAENGISADEIIACLKSVYDWELTREEVREQVEALQERYTDETYAFELKEVAGGYRFLTKKPFHNSIHTSLQIKDKKRLSTAALETLAIIAYKQPVSKPEIEKVRGVNCDYSIQKLLEKDLIAIKGKSDGPGRPLIYVTSPHFMDHFGLKSMKDLPKLKDLKTTENEIGMPSGDDEPTAETPVAAEEESAPDSSPQENAE
jgi:segregation and condensation protein B